MHSGTGGSFCRITFSRFGILPFLNFKLQKNLKKLFVTCTTTPFCGYVNKTVLMICDGLDIQRIPAFAVNVVRGVFRWSFYRDLCPIYSHKILRKTVFFKKQRTGFINFFLCPWKFNVFVSKMI